MNLLQPWCLLRTTPNLFYPVVRSHGARHFEPELTEVDSPQIELNEAGLENDE